MVSSLALVLAARSLQSPTVTVGSLLREMTDFRSLARRANPWYDYRQASSYDRNSDNWKDPFANGDAGQFLRREGNENVMADLRGPGAVARVWSANPYGVIRFYFDGESTPRLEGKMADMLSGRNPLFADPFSYTASQGHSLYFPLPYARSLKVTWDPAGERGGGLYYQVGHRDYSAGTRVESFTPEIVQTLARATRRTAADLLNPLTTVPRNADDYDLMRPKSKLDLEYSARNGGELSDFYVIVGNKDNDDLPWSDPKRIHNVLRHVRLRMAFDGESTVDVPLGDFFGAPYGSGSPYRTLPIEVKPDGTMFARWTMPYRKDAKVTLTNEGTENVRLRAGVKNSARRWEAGNYYFHAGWHSQTKSTRPMYDYNYVTASGEGKVVGVALQVSNPVGEWWGEGDEKVYVDGQTWPNLFGTGSEDYFGYAWCDPTPFERPFHAQPPTRNIGNFGQTENMRFHFFDPIPYRKSVKFDMEAWHWKEVECTYATTAFWYAAPGGTGPREIDPNALAILETPIPKGAAGAIEGEDLDWRISGGEKEKQGGFPQLSGFRQFWWRNAPVNATASVSIPVKDGDGKYDVIGNMGFARDYGTFALASENDSSNRGLSFDFYQPELEWKQIKLGMFTARNGKISLTFSVRPPNSAAEPANMLGADYFLVRKL